MLNSIEHGIPERIFRKSWFWKKLADDKKGLKNFTGGRVKKWLDVSQVDSLWKMLSIRSNLEIFSAENLGGFVLGYHTIFLTKTVNSVIFGGSFIFSNSVDIVSALKIRDWSMIYLHQVPRL